MNFFQAILRILGNVLIAVFFSAGILSLSAIVTGPWHWVVFVAAVFSSALLLPQLLDDTRAASDKFKNRILS